MKYSKKNLVALGAVALIAGCTNYVIGPEPDSNTTNSPFLYTLNSEYRRLAELEFYEGDLVDAFHFGGRVRLAAGGKSFGPQEIIERMLPADKVAEMTEARNRLVVSLGDGVRTKPQAAARALAGFDCWMQEQEENFQPEDIAACKTAFFAALDELTARPEPVAKPAPMMQKMAPMEQKVALIPPLPDPVTITFGFDKSRVTLAARAIIKDLAAKAKAAKVTRIIIGAHADRAGSDAYNNRLAKTRLSSIRAAMIAEGIPASMLQSRSYGESRPKIATPDGQRLRDNRRVEISFERN